MEITDFTVFSPGRLVSTAGAVAFVPNPLPDQLALDAVSTRLLSDAEHAIGRLVGSTARLVNPYLIASPLLHREAILSSRIEGTITSPEQLVMVEAGAADDGTTRETEDTREVRNYIRAMEHGLKSDLPLSLRLLRELHHVLLQGVRGERAQPGEFRTTQNYIGRHGATIADARFVPPPVPDMHECMNVLEARLNRDAEHLPLLVKVALVHYQFEAIHPFRDGNGRVGRLLIPLMMIRAGRLPQPVLYLSAFLERNRDAYMELLLRVSHTGDWLPWVTFFLRGLHESALESLEQTEAILALRRDYHQRCRDSRAFGQLEMLIDGLFEAAYVTIYSAANRANVSQATASAHIRKLVDVGILKEATGRKRNQIFVAHEILRFMKNRGDE